MKRALKLIAYGLAGILVTAGLTAAAFAVAGKDIAQPASPIGAFKTPAEPALSESQPSGGDHGGGKDHATKSPTPSPDNSGGGTSTGSGSGSSTPSPVPSIASPSPRDDGSGSSDSGSGDSGGDHHPDD